ncbi:unnamed protein product [Moneuplotes crassus]|uniref:Uncharacterized protein n=1 Tax=Euplotes crassus TaxID=5936 RepID=A0AAD1UKK2_EUPCR|nr:unnamed protein product [Moneuplotes crassus]
MANEYENEYFNQKFSRNPKIKLPKLKGEKILRKNKKIHEIQDKFESHLKRECINLFEIDRKCFKQILNKLGYLVNLPQANEGYLKIREHEMQGDLPTALESLSRWIYDTCECQNPYKEHKRSSIKSFSRVNRSVASIPKSRTRRISQDSMMYSESQYSYRNASRVQKVSTEPSLPDMKSLRSKLNKLLPDPKHPWRDPLKNTPFKWYELIDVSSGSEGEGDEDDKCDFLRKLTINRRKRREETECKMRELKMTPEYGMNAAKGRLKLKKKREHDLLYDEGVDKLTSRLTSELANSVAAYNLKILLKKKWFEDKKNYKIMSKLSRKQEERLSKVIPKHRFS